VPNCGPAAAGVATRSSNRAMRFIGATSVRGWTGHPSTEVSRAIVSVVRSLRGARAVQRGKHRVVEAVDIRVVTHLAGGPDAHGPVDDQDRQRLRQVDL